jgi:quercetin dioxygenase-like cupin family protein
VSNSCDRIEGLAAGDDIDGERPHVISRGKFDGSTIMQLTFRPGQALTDHSTAKPILLLGQRGVVTVTVDGTDVSLGPGDALHIAAHQIHAVTAAEPADVTLVLLG